MHYFLATYEVAIRNEKFGGASQGKSHCTVKACSVGEAESLVAEYARQKMNNASRNGELTIEVEIMDTVGY